MNSTKGKAKQIIEVLLGDGAWASLCPTQVEGLFLQKDFLQCKGGHMGQEVAALVLGMSRAAFCEIN